MLQEHVDLRTYGVARHQHRRNLGRTGHLEVRPWIAPVWGRALRPTPRTSWRWWAAESSLGRRCRALRRGRLKLPLGKLLFGEDSATQVLTGEYFSPACPKPQRCPEYWPGSFELSPHFANRHRPEIGGVRAQLVDLAPNLANISHICPKLPKSTEFGPDFAGGSQLLMVQTLCRRIRAQVLAGEHLCPHLANTEIRPYGISPPPPPPERSAVYREAAALEGPTAGEITRLVVEPAHV